MQWEQKGLSRRTIDVLSSAWREGTKKQYNVYFKLWKFFCQSKKINHWLPDINNVLEYLSFLLYDKKLSYSAINTARCALSATLIVDDQGHHTIGSHPIVSKFMRGVFNMNPPAPRYLEVWDVRVVLNHLRKLAPAGTLSLKQLTHKVVVLIALISAQRAQSLQKLRLDNCQIEQGKIVFYVDELIKQSRPGRVGCKLELPAYPPDRRLCVVTYIKKYIDLTKHVRKEEKALLISYKKPYKKVTVQTVSRWIKSTLHAAGIDTQVYKSHSTRAAATSTANKLQVPIDDILKVAGWANERTFRKFYNKPIVSSGKFAHKILHTL